MELFRKYGQATSIYFPLPGSGSNGDLVSGLLFSTGDCKIAKYGPNSFNNTTNLPVYIGNYGFKLDLTSTEMEASGIFLQILDTYPKTWVDQTILINTYGHSSAQHAFDLDTATQSVTLDSSENIYYADIKVVRDISGAQDEYSVSWFKNGAPIVTGITNQALSVYKRSDGSELILNSGLAEVGSLHFFKYDERLASRKISVGEPYLIVTSGTIDSSTRRWQHLVGRDG